MTSNGQSCTGKVALVTRAGTGIGRATAEQLAREGAIVVLGGRRPAPLGEVAATIAAAGGTAYAFRADATQILVARLDIGGPSFLGCSWVPGGCAGRCRVDAGLDELDVPDAAPGGRVIAGLRRSWR